MYHVSCIGRDANRTVVLAVVEHLPDDHPVKEAHGCRHRHASASVSDVHEGSDVHAGMFRGADADKDRDNGNAELGTVPARIPPKALSRFPARCLPASR